MTTLQTVRSFLSAESTEPAPWAPAGAPLDSLYALLRARRDDTAFWASLSDLLTALKDDRVRPDLIDGSELVDHASMRELLAALRELVPAGSSAPPTARSWLAGSNAVQGLVGFLLLGTAVGCPPVRDDDDSAEPLCDEATEEGITGEEGQVFCDLVEIIQDSSIASTSKADLLDCLPELAVARRVQLLAMFQDLEGEELADALYKLQWGECGAGDDDDFAH